MTEVLLSDAAGSTLKLMDYGGKTYRCTFFSPETCQTSHSIPLRPDDILTCAYPKSGSHWIWEITRILLDGHTETVDSTVKDDAMMENMTLTKAEALLGPRLLNCHLGFDELPKDLLEYKNKVIFIYRNVKDVAVSFYHMHTAAEVYEYDGKFNDYLSLFLSGNVDWGSYFDYMNEWDKIIKQNEYNLPFLLLSYEDLQDNPLREIRRISEFLGKDYDDQFLESVKETCSFQKMKSSRGHKLIGKDGKDIMYRKGIVGDWKSHFTVAQNEEMDNVIRDRLSHVQFQFVYE